MSLVIFLINLLKSDNSISEFLLSKKIIKSISEVKFRSLTPILPRPKMKNFPNFRIKRLKNIKIENLSYKVFTN